MKHCTPIPNPFVRKHSRFPRGRGAALGAWMMLAAACSPVCRADSGDLTEYLTLGQRACAGLALGVFADVDANGTWETFVVFNTIHGEAYGVPAVGTTYGDKTYFYSGIESYCAGSAPYETGRFSVWFVDATAPSFVPNNPATWTYKSVAGVRLFTDSDDMAIREGAALYRQVSAYTEHGQGGTLVGSYTHLLYEAATQYQDCEFASAAGIKEIYVRSDSAENGIESFVILSAVPGRPVITAQPQSQTVVAGNDATFSVAATSASPMTYDWRFNGASMAGETNTTLVRPAVRPADAGDYTVVVSNAVGSVTSAVAVLTVTCPAPFFVVQPSSQAAVAGHTVTLCVGAVCADWYQWRFNGSPISGATNSCYSLVNIQPPNAGNYTVVVTNRQGVVTSAVAVITVSYELVTRVNGGGVARKSPGQSTYLPGSTVLLTALPMDAWVFTGWTGDASGLDYETQLVLNTNKYVTANFTSTIPDLIVDNLTRSATFTPTSAWLTNTDLSAYAHSYRYTRVNSSGDYALYRPDLPRTGYYDVYLWYPDVGEQAATNAVVAIYSGDGARTNLVEVDQTRSAGFWRPLVPDIVFPSRKRAWWFAEGKDGFVGLVDARPSLGGEKILARWLLADAVKWVWSTQQGMQPCLGACTLASNRMTLTWQAEADETYRVQYKTNLPDTAWTTLPGDVLARDTTATKTDTTLGNAKQRYYRVLLLTSP